MEIPGLLLPGRHSAQLCGGMSEEGSAILGCPGLWHLCFCIFRVFSGSVMLSTAVFYALLGNFSVSALYSLRVDCYFPHTLNAISLHGNDNKVTQTGSGSLK